MKIHFVGGSGVGKSTLARHASQRTKLPLLPSAVRNVMDGSDPRTIFRDLDRADAFQNAVWAEQLRLESPGEDGRPKHFVSDRAFDCIAYAADQSRVTWEIVRGDDFAEYMQSLANAKERLVFFVRPEREIVTSALDGVRDPWAGWDCVCRIDGMVQLLLEMHGVRYVPVRGTSLRDRYRLVEAVLAMRYGTHQADPHNL